MDRTSFNDHSCVCVPRRAERELSGRVVNSQEVREMDRTSFSDPSCVCVPRRAERELSGRVVNSQEL